jgi:hypothetical protein
MSAKVGRVWSLKKVSEVCGREQYVTSKTMGCADKAGSRHSHYWWRGSNDRAPVAQVVECLPSTHEEALWSNPSNPNQKDVVIAAVNIKARD